MSLFHRAADAIRAHLTHDATAANVLRAQVARLSAELRQAGEAKQKDEHTIATLRSLLDERVQEAYAQYQALQTAEHFGPLSVVRGGLA